MRTGGCVNYIGVLVVSEIHQIEELTVNLCSRSLIQYLLILSYRTAYVRMHLVNSDHQRSAVVDMGFMSCWLPD